MVFAVVSQEMHGAHDSQLTAYGPPGELEAGPRRGPRPIARGIGPDRILARADAPGFLQAVLKRPGRAPGMIAPALGPCRSPAGRSFPEKMDNGDTAPDVDV